MTSEEWDLRYSQLRDRRDVERDSNLLCAVCGDRLLFSIGLNSRNRLTLFSFCRKCSIERGAHDIAEVMSYFWECSDREFRLWLSPDWPYVQPGDMPNYTEYRQYINSPEWKTKADEAKRRAGFRCWVCYKASKEVHDPDFDRYPPVILHARHRTYRRLGKEYPEDLIVLCADCHKLYHEHYSKETIRRLFAKI